MGRPHPQCWTGAGTSYIHSCHQPSGRTCIEPGCDQAAGTPWGRHWCPDCDVTRLERIGAGLRAIMEEADHA